MHGHPFRIVGTDGYPVPEAQALTKDVINIGPGERYDLLMTADNPGTWLFHCHILHSRPEPRGGAWRDDHHCQDRRMNRVGRSVMLIGGTTPVMSG